MSNSSPVRFLSGISTDPPYGPLASYGLPNPFFWHSFSDDFDANIDTTDWTKTITGNGTIAASAGDGGLALFTTNSSTPIATDIASIQKPFANFAPGNTLGLRAAFLCRLNVADVTNAGFIAGLIQTTTTPFTVVDGLYFLKASGATTLILRSTVGSVNTDLAIPFIPVNNVNLDLGFMVNRKGEVLAYAGNQLVGYVNQSERSAGVYTPAGPIARLTATITTANLNPTLAMRSGTTASTTMLADFVMAAKER